MMMVTSESVSNLPATKRLTIVDPAAREHPKGYLGFQLLQHIRLLDEDLRCIKAHSANIGGSVQQYVDTYYTGLKKKFRSLYEAGMASYAEINWDELHALENNDYPVWLDGGYLYCRVGEHSLRF